MIYNDILLAFKVVCMFLDLRYVVIVRQNLIPTHRIIVFNDFQIYQLKITIKILLYIGRESDNLKNEVGFMNIPYFDV